MDSLFLEQQLPFLFLLFASMLASLCAVISFYKCRSLERNAVLTTAEVISSKRNLTDNRPQPNAPTKAAYRSVYTYTDHLHNAHEYTKHHSEMITTGDDIEVFYNREKPARCTEKGKSFYIEFRLLVACATAFWTTLFIATYALGMPF